MKKTLNKQVPEHHFFVACVFGWVVHENLFEALRSLRKEFKIGGKPLNTFAFKVPGHKHTPYDIMFFTPQIEGSELIYQGDMP